MLEEAALEEVKTETPEEVKPEEGGEEQKEAKSNENRYSKRVKELNTKFREAERRAAELEKRLQEKEEATKLKAAPDRAEFDNEDAFRVQQAKWDAQVRESIRQEERKKIKRELETKKQQEIIDAGKNSYLKKRADYVKEDPNFHKYEIEIDQAVDQWQAPEIQNIILESKEFGPEIVAYFGKNPDELLDIASSSPAKRFFKMGQLVTKLQAKTVKTTSSAPEPIRSEKGSAKKVSVTGNYDPKRETFQEFARRRNSQ